MISYAMACRIGLLLVFSAAGPIGQAQTRSLKIGPSEKKRLTVANAHSHNDYQQAHPFTTAYDRRFGSMEADIFLSRDSLLVGHVAADMAKHRTIQALYLDSINFYVKANDGKPYKDSEETLQVLIDIKTGADSTLITLLSILERFPSLIHNRKIRFVITGNRPHKTAWHEYPDYLFFDGVIGEEYDSAEEQRIALYSANYAEFSQWPGHGPLNPGDSIRLTNTIGSVHTKGKKIRFWNAPDSPRAWAKLIQLGCDWINTDHIDELAQFLNSY